MINNQDEYESHEIRNSQFNCKDKSKSDETIYLNQIPITVDIKLNLLTSIHVGYYYYYLHDT